MIFLTLALMRIDVCANTSEGSYFGDVQKQSLSASEKKALGLSLEWMDFEQYPFRDGQAVTYLHGVAPATLICAPMQVCLIELQAGEEIQPKGLHLGDKARWAISPTLGAQRKTTLVVKPKAPGLRTTMAVVTDRRTYYLNLVSKLDVHMALINFDYPDEFDTESAALYAAQAAATDAETLPQTRERLSELDFGYSISKCKRCRFEPLRVYNDGARTIIQMTDELGLEAPALLVVSGSDEQVVNYRIRRDRYIIDDLFDEAVLIAGVGRKRDEVRIRRLGVSK